MNDIHAKTDNLQHSNNDIHAKPKLFWLLLFLYHFTKTFM